MAEADDNYKEGFLCPICHKDLRSPSGLITHFQELHSEEQAILKSIKDLYGKAKKKILKLEESELESFKNEIKLERYYLENSEPQEPGATRSHTDFYKSIRIDRLDHRTTETNKLIIRLDKLLRLYGHDRKQHEQELVPWLDGSTVSRCPSCASSFNLTRRQHHCRLCGSVMCHNCSCFLPYDVAQTIVAPVYNVGGASEQTHFKESDSLRICSHCWGMLENRRRVQIDQVIQPIIVQLYSQMQKVKLQIENCVEMYLKMYNSLTSGESTFLLQDLQSLRSDIARKGEMLDTLSKKISTLPLDETTPKLQSVQNNIRKAISIYIKDNILTLAPPPTPQELEQLKKDQTTRFTRSQTDNYETHGRTTAIKKVAVATGWSPATNPHECVAESDDDPLIQQMNIVRNYIEQARSAMRFDEVAALQKNLNELKESYRQLKINE